MVSVSVERKSGTAKIRARIMAQSVRRVREIAGSGRVLRPIHPAGLANERRAA